MSKIELNDREELDIILKDKTGQSVMKYKCPICQKIRYAKWVKGQKVWTDCTCRLGNFVRGRIYK